MPCPSIGPKWRWSVRSVLELSQISIKSNPKHFGSVQNGLDSPKRIGSVQNKLDQSKTNWTDQNHFEPIEGQECTFYYTTWKSKHTSLKCITKCRRSSHGQFQTLLHFGQGNWFLALEDFLFGENPSCLFTTPIWPLTTSEKWLPSSKLSSWDRFAWSPAVNKWKNVLHEIGNNEKNVYIGPTKTKWTCP